MFRRVTTWIWWLALLAAGFNTGAAESVKILRWTTEDGLPQNRIACLQQTRDGYLWLGTWFGLARFDGVRFTVFNTLNTPALGSDTINALVEDADGALWIGTKNGLVKYSDGAFQRFTTTNGLPANDVWRIAPARAGGIWFHSGMSVVREQAGKFSIVFSYRELSRLVGLQENAAGQLNLFLNNEWRVWTNNLPSGSLLLGTVQEWLYTATLGKSPGLAFAGTSDGVRQCDAGQTISPLVGGFETNRVFFSYTGRDGKVWAQSESLALKCWDGAAWSAFDLGAVNSGIVCAEQDAQGNLWFGTTDGLVQVRFLPARTFTKNEGLPDDNVRSVCESGDGTIWVGTDKGLATIRHQQVERVKIPAAYPEQKIVSVWPAGKNGVWIGSWLCGVQKYEHGSVTATQAVTSLTALFEDKAGQLWLGTPEKVLCRRPDGSLAPPAGAEFLKGVHSIYQDAGSNLWFGAMSGLIKFGGDGLMRRTQDLGFPETGVWAMHQDARQVLWFGTERGLVRDVRGKCFAFPAATGLPEIPVNCLLEDAAGAIWFSTLYGIYRATPDQLNAVADGAIASIEPFLIGTADGMATAEANGETQPTGWRSRDGKLWFATGKGVVCLNPQEVPVAGPPPVPLIESFIVEGRPVNFHLKSPIKIPAARAHALELGFTMCDLGAPERARFQTRLIGAGKWSGWTSERKVSYFNLPPGHYRFELLAMDHHGQTSRSAAALTLVIAPFFWQTFWFYGVCGLVAIGLGFGWQGYRRGWQYQFMALEKRRAVAAERARIARDLHDDLGTALTGLALELDVLRKDFKEPGALDERLGRTAQRARELAERMREVVWAANPQCDTVSSLASFLEQQVQQFLRLEVVRLRLDFPEEIPAVPIGVEARHQLALSVREALTNVVKHARATEVHLSLRLENRQLVVVVRDNGQASPDFNQNGQGLKNMKARMQQVGGEFILEFQPGVGTTISFCLPLNEFPNPV